MCGRFVIELVEDIYDRFGAAPGDGDPTTHFNVAPTHESPVVLMGEGRRIDMVRWGIRIGEAGALMINSRAEGLEDSVFHSPLMEEGRCLVPATGFYEWRDSPVGKLPEFFHMVDGRMFSFAGLVTRDASGPTGFSIITTEADSIVSRFHPRMPAILRREDEDEWLEGRSPHIAMELLNPYGEADLVHHPVSRRVNDVAAHGEDLIRPVGYF